MPSWVRYSVSVYLGLLLAGSLVTSPSSTIGSPQSLRPPSHVSTVAVEAERKWSPTDAQERACEAE